MKFGKTYNGLEQNVLESNEAISCYHCGEEITSEDLVVNEKHFCCNGCKVVYEIINENNLCDYYNIEKTPGINQKKEIRKGKFDFLNNEKLADSLIHFKDEKSFHVQLNLPQMHCNSCVWILENLRRINSGIVSSQVNFINKEIKIVYDYNIVSLKEIAELLTKIGYEPYFNLNQVDSKKVKHYNSSQLIKIGIAGFCFANIMMLSFPEYFSSGKIETEHLQTYFNYWNLFISLPVIFYCANEFFISGFAALKQKYLNIDAPIALAILITFTRSVYEIMSGNGVGYLDSMSGIVFFMLIGRYFQNKTYKNISFDRDYKSYFPIGVTVIESEGNEIQKLISDLKVGDRIKIYNNETIPADSILFFGKGVIDYSFVTGESHSVNKSIGEIVYAGGVQTAGAIELEVIKEVSQSYLTDLWNKTELNKNKNSKTNSFVQRLSKQFTLILFSIAIITLVYWLFANKSIALNAFTSILIVACPCALLLSSTFSSGTMIKNLSRLKFYLKNELVIENISKVDVIVFDKTGTITNQDNFEINFLGADLNEHQKDLIRSLASQSNHPLNKKIIDFVDIGKKMNCKNFEEHKGLGISALINGEEVKLGSAQLLSLKETESKILGTKVYVSINTICLGFFSINQNYRNSFEKVIERLNKNYSTKLLSGDNNSEAPYLKTIFKSNENLFFNQTPIDKLNYIKHLQDQGLKVMMIGDGLNDAGALLQSDVGIAISNNSNCFTPASDAILEGSQFYLIPALINYCRANKVIVYSSFILSILYNFVGLYFAVQGKLQPVIAAILMPVSSISIVLLTTGLNSLHLKKIGHPKN